MEYQRGNEMKRPSARLTRQHESIEPRFIFPIHSLREAFSEVNAAFLFTRRSRKHERRFPIVVPADHAVFVAGVDEELGNGREAMFRREVQRRVGAVVKVRVAQVLVVVADDALDEGEVVEEDGAPESPGYVNPERRH